METTNVKTVEQINAPVSPEKALAYVKAIKHKNKLNAGNAKAEKEKAKKLSNVINTLVEREQRYLYKFQTVPAKEKLSAKKAKQARQKIRRQLDNFFYDICIVKDAAKKAESIKKFLAFYKATYILNDFSLQSLTDSRDSGKAESFKDMLKVVQNSLGNKK